MKRKDGLEWNGNENDLENRHEPILENIDPNVYKFSRWSDGEYENLDPLLSKVGTLACLNATLRVVISSVFNKENG